MSVRPAVDAPVTWAVVATATGVFLAQAALAARAGVPPHVPVAALFVERPVLAWAVAPLLHHGVRHLAANVLALAVAAPVERRVGTRWTLALLAVAGYLPLFAEGLKLAALAGDPHVGAYGASAFAFGLLGSGLVLDKERDPRWWLVVLTGVAAALVVSFDVVMGLDAPLTVNVGHLGGLLAGAGIGALAD